MVKNSCKSYLVELIVLYDSVVLGAPYNAWRKLIYAVIQEGQGSPLERKTILI